MSYPSVMSDDDMRIWAKERMLTGEMVHISDTAVSLPRGRHDPRCAGPGYIKTKDGQWRYVESGLYHTWVDDQGVFCTYCPFKDDCL